MPSQDYDFQISFFDPLPVEPPRPADPVPQQTPPWFGPPDDVLPGIVGLELPLVHTARQVMWIGAVEVYPTGIAFSVLMCGQEAAGAGVEMGPGTWRFGVQLSQGGKATVHGVRMFSRPEGGASRLLVGPGVLGLGGDRAQSPPDGPVLRARGGGGSRRAWRQEYWLWPLPPPGDLLFACEWPDLEIEFTTATISTSTLHDAVDRAQPMWPEQGPRSE